MPGMMDSVLNQGLNDDSVEGLAEQTGNERFAHDAYRRLIDMFGDVVVGIDRDRFENAIGTLKEEQGAERDIDLTADDLEELVRRYKAIYHEETGEPFPQAPAEQLERAINAVFDSWMNERAVRYREIKNITDLRGTAVTVQAMVFSNTGDESGTGVCFTRNPATGENELYGEFLQNAQGSRGHSHSTRHSGAAAGDALHLRGAPGHLSSPGGALRGNAGPRVYRLGRLPLHPPDAGRKANRPCCPQDYGRHGRRRPHRRRTGGEGPR
jgi:phosphoenolpyruvate synthase/pyruvate phosphate dikinase